MTRGALGVAMLAAVLLISGCDAAPQPADMAEPGAATGPHGGRLLVDGDFTLEVAIFEAGMRPELRLWATVSDAPVNPADVDVRIRLERLGGVTDEIGFNAQGDYLRGDAVVYEPHSFIVDVEARHGGRKHEWRYDSFEGRTEIAPEIAEAAGIATEPAGAATIRDFVGVYGRVVSNPESVSHVTARFDGVIQSVAASIGDEVRRGQVLATVEANDSLNAYSVEAPISGTVIEKHANPGETTGERTLFTIVDTSNVWAELAIFPSDRSRVSVGSPVTVRTAIGDLQGRGTIALLSPVAGDNQSVTARVPLANPDGVLAAGMYLTAEVEVASHQVPLAVRRSALQPFRDFTVVFARYGDTYEVRMLDLGRQDEEWAEVLGGLDPGTPYVTANSYIIKADIEKSGASHDH